MRFEEIKFKREEEGDPWLQASMGRNVFKDCAIRVMLDPSGLFDDYPENQEESVRLAAYCEIAGKIVACHKAAFNHFMENAPRYETRLLNYLLAKAKENLTAAIEAEDSPKLQAFIKKHSLRDVSGLNKQISWCGLGLFDHGWEDIGFVTLDFHCSWDVEHGISILMHRDRIIAEGGLAEWSNRGDALIESAKCTQSYTTGYDIKLP
jgi:hypothetical protein